MESLEEIRANKNLEQLLRVKVASIRLAKKRGFEIPFDSNENRFFEMGIEAFGAEIFHGNMANYFKMNRHTLNALYYRNPHDPQSGRMLVWFAYLSDGNSQIAVQSIREMVQYVSTDPYVEQIVIVSSKEVRGEGKNKLKELYANRVNIGLRPPTCQLMKENALLVDPFISNLSPVYVLLTDAEKEELYSRMGLVDKNMRAIYQDDPPIALNNWPIGMVTRVLRDNGQVDTIAIKQAEYALIKYRPADQKAKKVAAKKQALGNTVS